MNEILIKNRDILIQAATRNYIHGISAAQAGELYKTAKELGLPVGKPNCPKCVLQMCIKLGKYILDEEAKAPATQEPAQETNRDTQDTPNTEDNKTISTTKKKAPGRKTKNDKK